jgi:branched-chain amino acid transport system substrate-binding protein
MVNGWLLATACWLAASGAAGISAQSGGVAGHTCECGAHPPGAPRDRAVTPYAGEPADMSPYAKFAAPYDLNYIHPNIYSGGARDVPEPKDVKEVRIGFLGPIERNSDAVLGVRMLHGAQMAIDDANARGGYGGKPFKLVTHNDYDNWQAKAVYGDDRPTDPAIWGSASNETVKMAYDDEDWAIFGSISSEATHIALRVALRAEIPIVNSASTDPTIPETYIPWYFTNLQDDRVQSFTIARRVFTELGLKRVAILRVNNRYGRFGVIKLRDAARRLGHPIVIEQKYLPGDTDFARQLKVIQDSRTDGIILWADQAEAAGILKQMQSLGMKQRVFGAYRTLGPELLEQAGAAAEGFEAVFPYDAARNDPRWVEFNRRFEEKYQAKADAFAALAYDAMNALLDSICKAGLNRARIHDALASIDEYDGVTGHMVFDPNQKNVAPMFLGSVHDGSIKYRAASMEKLPPAPPAGSAATNPETKPYAHVGEEGVSYAGPRIGDVPGGAAHIVLFGPKVAAVAHSAEVISAAGQWRLTAIESDQNWGVASTQLVRALMDEHALAVIALDRNSAHLAEQMGIKALVPVVALSGDKSLTANNVPWIFRLPAETRPELVLRLLGDAVEESGMNSERLRDVLASGKSFDGIAFLSTGEPKL